MNKKNKDSVIVRLNNDTSQTEIKTYFTKIFDLKQSGKEFPVNLNDVWRLVYSRKDKAVRVLTSEFIEGEDYITQNTDNQVFPQNGENLGGRPSVDYYLSVPCLEYFIAKRVREVFEVYRSVFHKVIDERKDIFVNQIRTKSDYRALRKQAYEMVVLQGSTHRDAAQALGVSEQSISAWAKNGNWRDILLANMEGVYESKLDNVLRCILTDVCEIEDKELRLRIVNKLTKGGAL
jgi:DNA-binding XRE family transcriptional regulator